MQLLNYDINLQINEIELIESKLKLNNSKILELGCGAANFTKKLAANGEGREFIACEVDLIQHNKNIQNSYENIEFCLCGAQELPFEDESFDFVFMFKSLHHVPLDLLDTALKEINRVLKPNAFAYFSEPLFLGDQNRLIAMFHDEEEVRIKAFMALENAIDKNLFKLYEEIFFKTQISYENFEDFKQRQMMQTFNDYTFTDELMEKIQIAYDHLSDKFGYTNFEKPFRVDILQKV